MRVCAFLMPFSPPNIWIFSSPFTTFPVIIMENILLSVWRILPFLWPSKQTCSYRLVPFFSAYKASKLALIHFPPSTQSLDTDSMVFSLARKLETYEKHELQDISRRNMPTAYCDTNIARSLAGMYFKCIHPLLDYSSMNQVAPLFLLFPPLPTITLSLFNPSPFFSSLSALPSPSDMA